MRAGLAGGGARKVTLIPVGANADWYEFIIGAAVGHHILFNVVREQKRPGPSPSWRMKHAPAKAGGSPSAPCFTCLGKAVDGRPAPSMTYVGQAAPPEALILSAAQGQAGIDAKQEPITKIHSHRS
jgi:hypothetical protein